MVASRRLSTLLAPALLAASLAACTASNTSASGGESVAFTPCDQQCTGSLDGAKYEIVMPERWNGTLLLYSHGYRSAFPTPPDNTPPDTSAEPAPGYSGGRTGVADDLLGQGYALAGSSFPENGWAVSQAIKANKALYQHFAQTVAEPQRVYLWGDSMGGLITEMLAEQAPDWVSGAVPMCAPMAGLVANMALGLDLASTYATLLDPGFQIAGYSSAEQANAAFQRAATRIQEAAKAGGRDAAAVLALASVVDANPKTTNFDARDATSRVAGAAEAALIAMAFSTGARYEAEQRFGGVFATNSDTDYGARLSKLDREWIDHLGGPGTAEQFVADLQDAPVVTADPEAAKRAARYVAAGQLQVPTISLHTSADPLVLVQNQSVFTDSVNSAQAQPDLLSLFVVPPRRFALDGPAPYGAGHCNFTRATRVGAIELLDGWVRTGTRPDPEQVVAAIPDSGIDLQYVPPEWPVGGAGLPPGASDAQASASPSA